MVLMSLEPTLISAAGPLPIVPQLLIVLRLSLSLLFLRSLLGLLLLRDINLNRNLGLEEVCAVMRNLVLNAALNVLQIARLRLRVGCHAALPLLAWSHTSLWLTLHDGGLSVLSVLLDG